MKKEIVLALAIICAFTAEISYANGPTSTNFSQDNALFSKSDYSINMLKKRRKGRGRGAFGEGNSIVSIGYGAPNLLKSLFKLAETPGSTFVATGSGPFHLKYEYGVSDKVGLGLSLSYVSFGFEEKTEYTDYDENFNPVAVSYTDKYSVNNIAILARFNYHLGRSKTFDPYFGGGLGVNLFSTKFTTNDPNNTIGEAAYKIPGFLAFESVFGVRYYFSDNIGMYAEVGFAKSLAQAGINFKF